MVMQATASSMPCRPPPFSCQRVARALDLRAPASPSQLRHQFVNLPDAGRADGMALGLSPPDGLTGMRPPSEVSPRSDEAAVAEIAETEILDLDDSPIAVASCTSATETSAGPMPALSYAFFAASAGAMPFDLARVAIAASLDHRGQHADRPLFVKAKPLQSRSGDRIAAAAPSEIGEHIGSVSG